MMKNTKSCILLQESWPANGVEEFGRLKLSDPMFKKRASLISSLYLTPEGSHVDIMMGLFLEACTYSRLTLFVIGEENYGR